MFTGIIEEIGKISRIERSGDIKRFTIYAPKISGENKKGDSISVDGVCLTVTETEKEHFKVELVEETLRRTTLAAVQETQSVNLERALTPSDRLGGHILTGHIDGIGQIVAKRGSDTFSLEIEVPSSLMKYIIPNGSIGVDGISLTVREVEESSFILSIIPYTASCTTIGTKKVNDRVNLETDIFAKYVERIFYEQKESITVDFLKEKGFL